jgi:hypothetical protein
VTKCLANYLPLKYGLILCPTHGKRVDVKREHSCRRPFLQRHVQRQPASGGLYDCDPIVMAHVLHLCGRRELPKIAAPLIVEQSSIHSCNEWRYNFRQKLHAAFISCPVSAQSSQSSIFPSNGLSEEIFIYSNIGLGGALPMASNFTTDNGVLLPPSLQYQFCVSTTPLCMARELLSFLPLEPHGCPDLANILLWIANSEGSSGGVDLNTLLFMYK